MALTLMPETEMRLRAYAEKLDLDPEQLSASLLTRAFEEAEAELKETMDGLDRSVEDYNAGRWITSEEHDRQLEALATVARANLRPCVETHGYTARTPRNIASRG